MAIEPLALATPRDCFYVRFGKFSNFLWLTHVFRELGGDVNTMAFARGLKQDLRSRFERQFAIRYSFLADLFGNQVVSDLAVIGNDLFLADGSSMGMLLQARSMTVLNLALAREQTTAMTREKTPRRVADAEDGPNLGADRRAGVDARQSHPLVRRQA